MRIKDDGEIGKEEHITMVEGGMDGWMDEWMKEIWKRRRE